MTNVATKWYYAGYDDCSFESPQAPAATQLRIQYRRERDHLDHQQALLGPTGIGRRRLNDQQVTVGDGSSPTLNEVYPRVHGGEGEGGISTSQQPDRQQTFDYNNDLTQRLRFENLILQHKADQISFRERQRALSDKVKDILALEEKLLTEGVIECSRAGEDAALTERGQEQLTAETLEEATQTIVAPRSTSPLTVKVDELKQRHDQLLAIRKKNVK